MDFLTSQDELAPDSGSLPGASPTTPGILDRFVLRNTPVPILLREFLVEHPEYEFVEDYNLPDGFAGVPGLPEPQRTSFFLRDRAVIRVGVVGRRTSVSGESKLDVEFSRAMRDELLRCGKNAADFVVLPFAPGDEQNRDVFRGRGVATIIWLQERTTLENLIGAADRTELPPKLIMRATELLPDAGVVDRAVGGSGTTSSGLPRIETGSTGLVVPVASGEISTRGTIQANAQPSVQANTQGKAKDGWMELPPPVHAAPEPEPPPPPVEWRDWNNFRYGVSGTTRGRLRRRMLIRHNGGFLRTVLLAAEQQPTPEYLAGFFEQIGDAADPVRAHREWLRREALEQSAGAHESDDVTSISFALNKDGRFLSAGRGIRPLLWRAEKRRLVLFPTTRSAESMQETGGDTNPFRLIRGTLNEGDRLLLAPGRFASHELRELFDLFKNDDDDELRRQLDNFLDYRSCGKALLLTRSSAETPTESAGEQS